MAIAQEPLLFNPVYQAKIWGGSLIRSYPRHTDAPASCGESWEISAHPAGTNTIFGQEPPLSFAALCATGEVAGSNAPNRNSFPLLFKIIDANDDLSVQVHPNNANARLTGGEPKTEMWYVLAAKEDACLYAGLKEGVTPETLRKAIEDGSAAELLYKLPVREGQSLFIPGGLVHAIGKGCVIYEVQQSSDTTWRLFDWNRTDAEGKSRQLHIEQALKSIDFSLPRPELREPVLGETHGKNFWYDIVSCPYFNVRQLKLNASERISLMERTFHAIFPVENTVKVTANGTSVTVAPRTSCLVPAFAGEYTIEAAGKKTPKVLITSLPDVL